MRNPHLRSYWQCREGFNMNLCKTFQRRAISTWNLLRKARVSRLQLGEETITDINLLEIQYKHPHEVILYKFTKPQESRTGADWEWWLTGPSGLWLGLRIQAKVLSLETVDFPHMYYRSKSSSKDQTELLIEGALNNTPPRIPLYCLYVNWDVRQFRYHWRCGTFRLSARSYGCSLVSAFLAKHLKGKIKSSPKLHHMLPYMLPWQCLVCCRGYGDGDLPQRAYHYWRGAILTFDLHMSMQDLEIREALFARYQRIEPTREPPRYVLQLLEGDEPDQLDNLSLQGVLIIQEPETMRGK